MIKKEDFFKEFNGHGCRYSSYLVIGTTADAVIKFLNEYDSNMCVGSGKEENGNVYFEISRETPKLIYPLTKELQTVGYADTDWDVTYTACAKNGEDFDDYTAEWADGSPDYRGEEEDCWDAFVTITDPSGAAFNTGAGAVDDDVMEYYRDMVRSHRKTKVK